MASWAYVGESTDPGSGQSSQTSCGFGPYRAAVDCTRCCAASWPIPRVRCGVESKLACVCCAMDDSRRCRAFWALSGQVRCRRRNSPLDSLCQMARNRRCAGYCRRLRDSHHHPGNRTECCRSHLGELPSGPSWSSSIGHRRRRRALVAANGRSSDSDRRVCACRALYRIRQTQTAVS